MKKYDGTYDYEYEYEVVPEWVTELMDDTFPHSYVISRQSKQWVMSNREDTIDLEEHR